MVADVSLVYLSTASTILYFSSLISISLALFLRHPSGLNHPQAQPLSCSSLSRPSHGRVSHKADMVHLFVTPSSLIAEECSSGLRRIIQDTCEDVLEVIDAREN